MMIDIEFINTFCLRLQSKCEDPLAGVLRSQARRGERNRQVSADYYVTTYLGQMQSGKTYRNLDLVQVYEWEIFPYHACDILMNRLCSQHSGTQTSVNWLMATHAQQLYPPEPEYQTISIIQVNACILYCNNDTYILFT